MPGHTGDGVIQNDHGGVGAVVGHVDQTRHAGMHKGGVADDCHGLPFGLTLQHAVEAVNAGDGSTHTQGGIHRAKGSHRAQGITADVTQNGDLILRQGIIHPSVRTARAHHRRTGRDHAVCGGTHSRLLAEGFCNGGLGEFPETRELLLADHGNAHGLHRRLDDGIQLLDDVQSLHLGGELRDQFLGQGVGHTDLQNGNGISQSLSYVLIAGAGGDDTDLSVPGVFRTVEGTGLGVLRQGFHSGFHHGVALFGVAGHHHVFFSLLHVGLLVSLHPLPHLCDGLGVCNTGTHSQKNGGVELFGQIKGRLGKLQGFHRIRRL